MDVQEPLTRIVDAARGAVDAVAPVAGRMTAGAAQARERLRPPSVAGPVRVASRLIDRQRRRVRGIELGQEAVARKRQLGDRRGEAVKLNSLGREYRRRGRHSEAIVCYTQALVIFRELGARRGEGLSLSNLGLAYADQGNRVKAVRCFEDALDIFRMLGDTHIEGQVLANLGTVYRRHGQVERAQQLWSEAMALIAPGSSAHRAMAERVGDQLLGR